MTRMRSCPWLTVLPASCHPAVQSGLRIFQVQSGSMGRRRVRTADPHRGVQGPSSCQGLCTTTHTGCSSPPPLHARAFLPDTAADRHWHAHRLAPREPPLQACAGSALPMSTSREHLQVVLFNIAPMQCRNHKVGGGAHVLPCARRPAKPGSTACPGGRTVQGTRRAPTGGCTARRPGP